MFKYVMTAAALKFFSATPQTRRVYRHLGNRYGQRLRTQHGMDKQYTYRAKKIIELCEKHHAVKDGSKLLEIGTGWVHWESTIIRLFYDVEITLFDVWDNRHLSAYKRYVEQLEEIIGQEFHLDAPKAKRIHRLLEAILKCSSFEEIYHLLNFRYVINPAGTLEQFQDAAYDVIFSWNVMEHVHRSILPGFVRDFHRLLVPGGYSIQKIDPGDHLAYYDQGVCQKNYLRYSEKVWRRYFENDVQYFNRVQRPEWLEMFQQAGFEMVEEELRLTDIQKLTIDKRYEGLSRQDLACLTLAIIHRKPQG